MSAVIVRASDRELEFRRRPSVLAFMARALGPRPGLDQAAAFPPIRVRWRGCRVERRDLAAFLRWTGIPEAPAIPVLHPHVFGFRLHLVVLTHPGFPLPLWRALQIRNRIEQRRPIAVGDALDLETAVGPHRFLELGAEVDLLTTVRRGTEVVWASATTFYYRGRFGAAHPTSPPANAPEVRGEVVATWRTPADAGGPFAALTGDYNPIHWSSAYARRSGFARAFLHPALAAGQCLAHLPPPESDDGEQRLDLWLKGPVYRRCEVRLGAAPGSSGSIFALSTSMDARPAIVGAWGSGRRP